MRASKIARLLPWAVMGVAGIVFAAYLASGTGDGSRSLTATPVHAATLPGMASLSGTVQASKPFKAAQVYIRNVDKRILYMVYTDAGRYRAVSLFPGNYEIRVITKGLESDVQKLAVKAGDAPKLNISLHDAAAGDELVDTMQNLEGEVTNRIKVTYDGYDNVYPAGPGRDIAERTCMICHGENFLAAQPTTAAVWATRIDKMTGKANYERPAESYAEGVLSYRAQWLKFNLDDRQVLLDYLVKNFGPGAKPRMVRTGQEAPLDEVKLGKAMYMEYYIPEDPPGKGIHAPEFQHAFGYRGRRVIQDVRFDADGNVWGSDRGAPRRLVKLDPRTGEMKEWLTPHPEVDIHEVLIKDGLIYMPEHAEGGLRSTLLRFDPKTEKWLESIDGDPQDVVRNRIKWMQSQAFDSKGNLYVGWIMGGALSKFDAQSRKPTVFPLPSTNAIVYGVVSDRNDNMWMALWDSGKIAKFDTRQETWTEITPKTYPNQTRRVNVDYQNNIWWGIWAAGPRPAKIAKYDQATGKITEWTVPERNAQPYDVSQDLEGNIWFPDSPASDRSAMIGKLNPKDGSFTFYPKPQFGADTPKIQLTRDGAIWFAPRGSQKAPAISVLYPDMDKITTFGAFYVNGPPGYPFKPGVATTSATAAAKPAAAPAKRGGQ
jgi:streptogramin lyase/cytochrome c5